MTPAQQAPDELSRQALEVARRALRLAAAYQPHLAGLAHMVRVLPSQQTQVASIGPTGLMLINPQVYTTASLSDLAFVMAHELMHLALDTFSRTGDADPQLVNIAHDYVINDILREEMRRPIPLGGLDRPGARHESLESILAELQRDSGGDNTPPDCWSGAVASGGRGGPPRRERPRRPPPKSPMRQALEAAGLAPPEEPEPQKEEAPPPPPPPSEPPSPTDLLTAEREAELEPGVTPQRREQMRQAVRKEAVRAASLRELKEAMSAEVGEQSGGSESGGMEAFAEAVRTAYQPPWQLALQHWLDAVGPSARTYARASRRGADRTDVVLPGRRREGWALHIVLDTSGSMVDTLPKVLGLITSFCEGAGVADVHILQCDVAVTQDEWIDVSELERYRVSGFGGSDMSPGMLKLAEDPEVAAVLVLTDGYINYPREEPPYNVLWGLVDGTTSFAPPYGSVVHVRM